MYIYIYSDGLRLRTKNSFQNITKQKKKTYLEHLCLEPTNPYLEPLCLEPNNNTQIITKIIYIKDLPYLLAET